MRVAAVPSAMARSTSTALAAQIAPARATSSSAAALRAASLAAVGATATSLEAALARAANSATGVAEGSADGSAIEAAAGGVKDSTGAAEAMTVVAALLIASGYRGSAASLALRGRADRQQFMRTFARRRARPWPERPVSAANKSGKQALHREALAPVRGLYGV